MNIKHVLYEFSFVGRAADFKENKSKIIERERSFRYWPHASPSRISMFTSGWLLDKTKGNDHTICPHCGVGRDQWQSTDNPLNFHQQLSPSCPFMLATQPIHLNSKPVKYLKDVLTGGEIGNEAVKSDSKVILTSDSLYARPPNRGQSFLKFSGGPPQNTDALVMSGFYYAGTTTLLKCYECAKVVNDFHQHPSNEINTRHHQVSPTCSYARLMAELDVTRSTRMYQTYTSEL